MHYPSKVALVDREMVLLSFDNVNHSGHENLVYFTQQNYSMANCHLPLTCLSETHAKLLEEREITTNNNKREGHVILKVLQPLCQMTNGERIFFQA